MEESPTGPIPNAKVTIQQSGQTICWGYTNQLGNYSIGLSAGTYSVTITAAGYTSLASQSLVVSDNGTSTYTLTQTPITPPPTSGLCSISAKLIRADNAAIVNAAIKVELIDKRATIPAGALSYMIAEGVTNGSGLVTLVVPYSSSIIHGSGTYRLTALAANGTVIHERKFTVPDQPTANYYQLPTVQ